MKKTLILFSLLLIPIIIYGSVLYYYNYYEKIAQIYDCYPIEKSQFDIDGDSNFDFIKIENDSDKANPYNYRFKVFLRKENQESEVLNIKYEPTDNTYRTHFGFLVENNTRKFIIYDTINENQFFYWNGKFLTPSPNPSEFEKQIRKSFYYADDTGGFHLKLIFQFLAIPFFIFYGLFLVLVFTFFELRKRRRPSLQ